MKALHLHSLGRRDRSASLCDGPAVRGGMGAIGSRFVTRISFVIVSQASAAVRNFSRFDRWLYVCTGSLTSLASGARQRRMSGLSQLPP